jgi:GTP cyclohydrolase II
MKNIIFSNKAKLPTKYGEFNIISFKQEGDIHEHCMLFLGEISGKEDVLTRIHSECLTGDVFTSQKCDCGEQLDESMKAIVNNKSGIILYLRQEGRGIGLFNKINAYALQDEGQDTIQANHSLGFDTDLRDFSIAVNVLEYFKVKSIQLLSNNPEKIKVWEDTGISVSERIPLIIERNKYNEGYLEVKKEQLNHLL